MACSDDSDCINRLTSIECVNWKCSCGTDCRNQRFQKAEYANVDVIQTEKKGYGLRALENLSQGAFVYEYIGEVISEIRFRKRAEEYKANGNNHFYFMMLQKGEYIDATTKGCLARFCNHSCNPNCYVDKWVVGDKLRMGIFTKREILKGEEITFDYNVDRYGSDAQPCYCGEPNCVGVLGGKTQTEAVNKLPQLVLDALDMDDQDEDVWLSNNVNRKKKRKAAEDLDEDYLLNEDDEDYSASLPSKPITVNSVSKIMSSLMQSREEWLVRKLINRIVNTDDKKIHLQVMNMHGYQIFNNLLRDWKTKSTDLSIIKKVLEIMTKWPRLTRNKISSSKIEVTVEEISKECKDEEITELAKTLLSDWNSLQMAYRIPRRERKVNEESKDDNDQEDTKVSEGNEEFDATGRPIKREENSLHKSQSFNSYEHLKQNAFLSQQPQFKKFKKYDAPNQDRYADLRLPEGPRKIVMAQQAQARAAAVSSGVQTLESGLPSGWHSAKAPTGRTYYYNRTLGVTQWERPAFQLPKGPHPTPQDGNWHKPSDSGLEDGADTEESRKAAQERVLQNIIAKALDSSKTSSTNLSSTATVSATANSMTTTVSTTSTSNTSSILTHQPALVHRDSATQHSRHSSLAIVSDNSNTDNNSYGYDQSTTGTPDIAGFNSGAGAPYAYNSEERSLSPHVRDGASVSPGLEPFIDSYSEVQIRTLQKAFAKVVPNIVVRYKDYIGHEKVKIYSREIVHILVSKELRGKPARIDPELTTEKRAKIKVFVKAYMAKVIQKLKSHHEPQYANTKSSETEGSGKAFGDFHESKQFSNDLFGQRLSNSDQSMPLGKGNETANTLSSPPTAEASAGNTIERASSTDLFSLNNTTSNSSASNKNVMQGIRGTIPSAPAGFNSKDTFNTVSKPDVTVSPTESSELLSKTGSKGQVVSTPVGNDEESATTTPQVSSDISASNTSSSVTDETREIEDAKDKPKERSELDEPAPVSKGFSSFSKSSKSKNGSGYNSGRGADANHTKSHKSHNTNGELSFKRQKGAFGSSSGRHSSSVSESRSYKMGSSGSSSTSWSAQQKLVMMAPPQYGDDYAGGDDCNEAEVGMAALQSYNAKEEISHGGKNSGFQEGSREKDNEEDEDEYDDPESGDEDNSENEQEGSNHRKGHDLGRGRNGYNGHASNGSRRGRGGFFRNKRGGKNSSKKYGNAHNGNKFVNGHGTSKGKFGGSRGKYKKSNW